MTDRISLVPASPPPIEQHDAVSGAAVPPAATAAPRPRVWPALAIVLAQWLFTLIAGWAAPGTMVQFYAMFMGPMVATGAFILWWLFASRVPWRDRWLGLAAFGAAGTIVLLIGHSTFNVMLAIVFALPVVTRVWAGWLFVTPFLSWPVRRAGLLAVVLLGWGYFTLIRFDGITGGMEAALNNRWAPTSEETFLAESEKDVVRHGSSAAALLMTEGPLTLGRGDWPGFRGPARDGRLPGVRIATDWQKNPPRQVWRRRVGPGWSSFAAVGQRLYTQEQRGASEVVICYDAATGDEVWVHGDKVRFTEAMAGPGPRATPTFHEGKIYSLGAKGTLNRLDAATGIVEWSRDVFADAGVEKEPIWGFAASPLVVDGVVTVFAGGPKDKSVLGYDASSGEPRWSAGNGRVSYCSTQLTRLGGVDQLVISTDQGLTGFEPASGTILWQYSWPLEGGMSRVIQPAALGESDLLIGTGFGLGSRRVRIGREGASWKAEDVWSTKSIRPYYNDLVVHGEHLYGFDNNLFTCVSLNDGRARWKARGYGNGQVVVLPDQDLLLILSETGEVALVAAEPTAHREIARMQAIEGKTWNHPVVAHGKLFVRNGEEAASYDVGEEDHATSPF